MKTVSYRHISEALAIAVVTIFAVAWALHTLGPTVLDIGDTHWLSGDLADFYTAWVQYMSDPNAYWLISNRMSYPLPMDFALFDPMPIFLLLAKPFAWLLPDGTQFLGWYFLSCVVLQGIFGYFATMQALRLLDVNYRAHIVYLGIIGGLLIATTPFTCNRFQGHAALSSQWVLVLSIWIILATLKSRRSRWIFSNFAVVFLASGINPYLTLMVVLSDVIVMAIVLRHLGWIEICARAATLVASAAFGLYVFGFMSAAGISEGGYGLYSMNALGPIDSNGSAGFFGIDIADATSGQTFEGYDYLGAGVLILCVMNIIWFFNYRAPTNDFPFAAILTVIMLCYGLALSTTLTFASYSIHLSVPSWLEHLLGHFRASGRLFWIGGFWLVLVAIIACVLRLGALRAMGLLTVLFVIQLIDIEPIARSVKANIAAGTKQELKGMPLGNYSAVMVYPPWQCDHMTTPLGMRNYESIGFFAAQKKIPTNNFYAARTPPEQLTFHCDYTKIGERISAENIYLLSSDLYSKVGGLFKDHFDCTSGRNGDTSWVCVPRMSD